MDINLAIDCRMINHSGIGVVIRSILSSLLTRDIKLTLLGKISDLDKYVGLADVVELNAPLFTIVEQIALAKRIPKCDVFWSPQYNIPIMPIRARKRIVTIADVYQMTVFDSLGLAERTYVRYMLKAALSKSDLVMTISEFSRKEIEKFFGSYDDKIEVIYLAPNDLPAPKTKNTTKYILYVGNVKPNKNLASAIRAFRVVAKTHRDIRFLIVGKKDGFRTGDPEIAKIAENTEETVEFTGHVNDHELASLYKNAELLLFPSKYEGFGLPILEAMRYGTPVVASNVASMPEIGGDAAVYCDPYSVDDIAEKVTSVLSHTISVDPDAMEKQVRRFNWEKTADAFLRMIEKSL